MYDLNDLTKLYDFKISTNLARSQYRQALQKAKYEAHSYFITTSTNKDMSYMESAGLLEVIQTILYT